MSDGNSSNDDLVTEIVRSLRGNPEADQALIEILAEHILKTDPVDTAVDDAFSSIDNLALERGETNT